MLLEEEWALSERLRIALVSVLDASDIRTFSGITYHVLAQLREQGVDVEVISPLKRSFRYVLAPTAILARLRKRGSSMEHYRFALRTYARQSASPPPPSRRCRFRNQFYTNRDASSAIPSGLLDGLPVPPDGRLLWRRIRKPHFGRAAPRKTGGGIGPSARDVCDLRLALGSRWR